MNMKQPNDDSVQIVTIDRETIQIPVIAVGKGWMIVDKPAGMTVHNESGRDLCSVVSAFIRKDMSVQRQIDWDPDFGVNPVHRLDKETSGLILLAVTREMFRFFSDQFESRQVRKHYVALLHGALKNPGDSSVWGIWSWTLAKTAGGRHNPEGVGARQESRTRYRVLDHSAHYTMAEIEPLSGRTHQIRRHAKLAGHPVVGDARYGSTRALNYLRRNHAFDRLALHALALTLRLSGGEEPKTFETPRIPGQMWDLFHNDLVARDP
jgi:RluA family pseudouridine synthase